MISSILSILSGLFSAIAFWQREKQLAEGKALQQGQADQATIKQGAEAYEKANDVAAMGSGTVDTNLLQFARKPDADSQR